MLSQEVKKYIDKSVLCWLATVNKRNEPNVSPKEMFTYSDDETIIIAHIASPNSVKNILGNPNVCISFIDVFIQKGFKVNGKARLIYKDDVEFISKAKPIIDIFTDMFPIKAIIEIQVIKVEKIQAPSYFLFPESTTEQSQIESAYKTYKVKPL